MSCSFVTQIDISLVSKIKDDLYQKKFTFSQPPYTFFSAKGAGLSVTFYLSGKLVIQGKNKDAFIRDYLEPHILNDFSYSYPELHVDKKPRIGMDEAGKGDFFGPLSIAGVYANSDNIKLLSRHGIRDSKTLSDTTVQKMARYIKEHCTHEVLIISPKTYNKMYAHLQNLNTLLQWGYMKIIDILIKKSECTEICIDQFAHASIMQHPFQKKYPHCSLQQSHKGERDIVIAAASILARSAFLEKLHELEKIYHMSLPKGSDPRFILPQGKKFIEKYHKESLCEVAKVHFSITQKIIS